MSDRSRRGDRREEVLALAALAFVLAVGAAWWWLALAPVPGAAPAWLQAARAACFGVHDDGLPGAGGWILLVGEPLGMLVALRVIAGRALDRGLRRLAARGPGRAVLGAAGFALLAGLGAVGWRVTAATRADAGLPAAPAAARAVLDPVPPLRLVDQHGDTFRLERLRGRPVLVAFAYGHCETVCPTLVHDALAARRRLPGTIPAPALVVVTLDPWRDVPARLPHLARHWGLEAGDRVLSGEVEDVRRVLSAWRVGYARDPSTGEVSHLPVTYVVDAPGRSARATGGTVGGIVAVLGAD